MVLLFIQLFLKIFLATQTEYSGKIETVVAVVIILFVAIVAFLIFIERKLKSIEKKLNR